MNSDGAMNRRQRMQRREFLLAAGAALGTLASREPALAKAAEDVVFNGAGGSWQDNARKAWLDPFAKRTGIKVIDSFPFDVGKLATMVRIRAVQWDVTDCPSSFLGRAVTQNLLEPIDYGAVDRATLPAENFGMHYVAYAVFSWNIVYDKRRISGAAPSSWKDFWDLKRFPGPRTFRRQPLVAFEAALLADGVARNKLYPLDVDRALRKLDEIKSEIRWWTEAQQSVQMIALGEVAMGVTAPSRAIAAREQGQPLEIVWNEGLMAKARFAVPRGAENKDGAMRLINFIIQPEQQAKFAMLNRTAPVNPKAYAMIEPSVASILATAPANLQKMTFLDELGYWTANSEALTKRFEAWLVA
jgi:putative spermidine/putrescine transport system substrate-binding protein